MSTRERRKRKKEEIIRGKNERERKREICQQLTDHVVAHELFALQLHPRTINDEPIVARTLTSIVEDNVCVCMCVCARALVLVTCRRGGLGGGERRTREQEWEVGAR